MHFSYRDFLTRLGAFGARPHYRIFLSYRRRGEGAGYAGRLTDRLVHEFGADQCFRDIDDIESGVDFVEAISGAVGSCDVLIAVIGPDWLTMKNDAGLRRLEDPNDFVRIEIAAALRRNIRVVPVLVGNAVMPDPARLPPEIESLARRQAHELSDTRWDYDVGQLVAMVERMGIARRPAKPANPKRRWIAPAGVVGAGALAVAITLPNVLDNLSGTDNGGVMRTEGTLPYANPADPGDPRSQQANIPPEKASFGDDPASAMKLVDEPEPASDDYEPPGVSTSEYDPVDANRDAIVDAIHRANRAEIDAQQTLDANRLAGAFIGEAMNMEILALSQLAGGGEYSVNELMASQILSIDVSPDESEAVVEAVETWGSTRFNVYTRQCLYRLLPHDVPQTVYLVRVDGAWIVSGIVTGGVQPQPAYC
ncbi:MAG: toll/interleukin-1 receptor domain-containing protein [Longimicrobiales bacterium]